MKRLFIIFTFIIIFIVIFYSLYLLHVKKEQIKTLQKEQNEKIEKILVDLQKLEPQEFNMHEISNLKDIVNSSKYFKFEINGNFETKLESYKKTNPFNLQEVKGLGFKNPKFPGHYKIKGKPGAYLETIDDYLILVNWDGRIYVSLNKIKEIISGQYEKIEFREIESNFQLHVNNLGFYKVNSQSVRDVYVKKNKIYLSFTNQDMDKEKRLNCFNIDILEGNFDILDEYISFKNIFKPNQCHIPSEVGEDQPSQSGGRIQMINNDIIVTFGDYRSRGYVQLDNDVIGKIFNTSKNKIISKGHRNPQGLYFDESRNLLLSTEHGPQGGDEINLIDVNLLNSKKYNFGWPISSYGVHYGNRKIEGSPLYKSHEDHGFDEPLKYFVPSIGISEIRKVGEYYYFGSMSSDERIKSGSRSISRFKLDENLKITNFKSYPLYERVRDIAVSNNRYLILSLEVGSKIVFIDTEDLK
tara:strand:- start:1140 stop:2546 length:1407 start_codon:yes stop_codon:yes gene_type:complete